MELLNEMCIRDSAQKACRYHVVDYLLKPVTEEQLSAVLDRCAAMLQQEITTSRIVVPQHQDRRMITQAVSYTHLVMPCGATTRFWNFPRSLMKPVPGLAVT